MRPSLRVDVGALVQQLSHDVGVTVSRRDVEARPAGLGVTVSRRDVEARPAGLGRQKG